MFQQLKKTENPIRFRLLFFLFIVSILLNIFFQPIEYVFAESSPGSLTREKGKLQTASIPSIVPVPKGLIPLNPPEKFGPDTLWEKIDGQAEMYLSAGFVDLQSQWFAESEDPASMIELNIYNMGDGLNAFSVYSTQRREDAEPVDLTQFGYQVDNSLFLVHGQYYLEVISIKPNEKILRVLKLLASNFIQNTPVGRISIKEMDLFPQDNIEKEGISLIARNAFGFERLDRVFTATYNMDGHKLTAFISGRKTPKDAKMLAKALHDFFIDFGGKDINHDVAVHGLKMVEIMDAFEVIFYQGTYLAGIHEAPKKDLAERLARSLAKRIGENGM
jgi:hypothetical protein